MRVVGSVAELLVGGALIVGWLVAVEIAPDLIRSFVRLIDEII